jgi:hypothetical protein
MNINQSSFSSAATNPISLQEITKQSWDLKTMQQHLTDALNRAIQDWMQLGAAATLKVLEQNIIEVNQL